MTKESMPHTEEKNASAASGFGKATKSKRETLRGITERLERAGVDYVVGGSGMLLGLGLTDDVRDWDLLTEAPEEQVRKALDGLKLTAEQGASELYGSGRKLKIENVEPEVEIIIGFAIRGENGMCRLPALKGGVRSGLRIASPEIWLAAYALMGRTEKASLLEAYLHERGADPDALARLREEPLPGELARRLDRLPQAAD